MPLPVIASVLGRIGLAQASRAAATRAATSGGMRRTLARGAYRATGSRSAYRAVYARGGTQPGLVEQTARRELSNRVQQRINSLTNNDNSQTTNNNQQIDNSTHSHHITPSIQPGQQAGPTPYSGQIGEGYPAISRGMKRAMAVMTLGATAAAGSLVYLTNRAQSYGRQVSEGQRYLEDFNSKIAYSFAQLELSRVKRNLNRGEQTSESAKYLNESLDRLEQKILPYQTVGQNVLNSAAAAALNGIGQMVLVAGEIAKHIPVIGDKLDEAIKKAEKAANKGIAGSGLQGLFDAQADTARRDRRAGGGI